MILFALKFAGITIGSLVAICLIYSVCSGYNEWKCHAMFVEDKYGILISFNSFKQYYYLDPSCWRVGSTDTYAKFQRINKDLTFDKESYHYWLVYQNDCKKIRVGMQTWKDYRQLIKFLQCVVEEQQTSVFNSSQRANYEWFLQDMQTHIEKLKEQAKQEREEAGQSMSNIIDRLKEGYNLG